jgi:hypothetical protein
MAAAKRQYRRTQENPMFPLRRPPPSVSALGLALSVALGLAAPSASASANMFCGAPSTANNDNPSDLSNATSDQSLEYLSQQPASILVCSKGYMAEKCGDHDTANRIFDKCIAAGYAGAMIWKARLLEEGNGGGPPDFAKSAELLHRAAVSGDPAYGPIAKMHYATALQLGRGVDKDEAAARRWFEEAAAEGSPEAREFLQTGYHTGSRDYSTLGAGTPTAAALAKSLPPDAGDAATADNVPRAVAQGGAGRALQARKLVSEAAAAPTPPLLAPPPAPPSGAQPQLDPAPATADVVGQKLERRDPVVAAAALPPAPVAALGLLLLAAFFAGMLRSKRNALRNAQPVSAPISMENPA